MRLRVLVIALGMGTINFSCNQINKQSMQPMTSHEDHAEQYTCRMHPEVTGNAGDKCPKCGMVLEKIAAKGKVSMSLTTHPDQVVAGKAAQLSLRPTDESNKTAVVELEETHEKMIHVIAVSEDLSWFDHIHAEPSGNGAYTVTETFPQGGNYLIYADYKPMGSSNQTDKIKLTIEGAQAKTVHHHEQKLIANTNGYALSLKNADSLETGSVEMPILAEKDGKMIKRADIENYLGAVAHIILVGQDEKEFIHIHPESTDEYPIYAHADIPKPGIYRMWVQFQTHGTVHTADFTLNIQEASGKKAAKHNHEHGGHKH